VYTKFSTVHPPQECGEGVTQKAEANLKLPIQV